MTRADVVCWTCDDATPMRMVVELAIGQCAACKQRVCEEHSRYCEEHGTVCVSCAVPVDGSFLCRLDESSGEGDQN